MKLTQTIEWLLSNGFVQNHKGKFKFTNKTYKQLTGENKGLTAHNTVVEPAVVKLGVTELLIPDPLSYESYKYEDWVQLYQNFIAQCKVPATMEASNGNVYSGNKYSEEGMKAFQKALRSGYQYDILRMAITLYYASSIRWKKDIGSYMTSGEWRSDYAMLVEQAQKGTLQQHIKQTVNHGATDPHYELG